MREGSKHVVYTKRRVHAKWKQNSSKEIENTNCIQNPLKKKK